MARLTPLPTVAGIAAFCRLLGVLKYGLVVAAILFYLPLIMYSRGSLRSLFGSLFLELSPPSAFAGAVVVFLTAWAVMIVEGLIVNGVELRFPGAEPRRAYRTFKEITEEPARILPRWADKLFTLPVTHVQFILFTLVLAGPAIVAIVLTARPGQRLWALVAVALAFVLAYGILILAAAPPAVLDPTDPPLRGRWPGAERIRTWRWIRAFAVLADSGGSRFARTFRMRYLLDGNGRIYPAHLFAAIAALLFVGLWIVTGYLFYPSRFTVSAVVSLYISLMLFVWFFGGLRFHLGRLHVSPLWAGALILVVGYFHFDHRYEPTGANEPSAPSIDYIDVAAAADENLVVVASAGGGAWAAGWTARGLEQLIANRPALLKEIRVLSAVSGGSVGAAYFIDGRLRGEAAGNSLSETMYAVRVRSTASTLGTVAYALTFRDFPRLVTGGIYAPQKDRGQLLEEEWARVAAAPIVSEGLGRRPEPMAGKRALRSLGPSIGNGTIPAPIFAATVMETGQRLMVTPIAFAPLARGERASTLSEFLSGAGCLPMPQPDLDLWTAARLSATFTYISPPARSWLDGCPSQKEHLIDGGYYDEFGVTSALDWLDAVLQARKAGDGRLRFKRVLLIQLSGFPEPSPDSVKPADGLTATLTGPTVTAFLALRQGVATSRNRIDLDRFKRSWNEVLKGDVQVEMVAFRPDAGRQRGPVSWHLTSKEIERLNAEWGPGTTPDGWQANLRDEWRVLEAFLSGAQAPR